MDVMNATGAFRVNKSEWTWFNSFKILQVTMGAECMI